MLLRFSPKHPKKEQYLLLSTFAYIDNIFLLKYTDSKKRKWDFFCSSFLFPTFFIYKKSGKG